LLGTAQAALIHEMVSERISPVDVVARKIAIGPPPVFQGRERDIMMVSMVLGPGDRAAANRADMHQRFNVALVACSGPHVPVPLGRETEFREDSLNGKVISHFKQPFRQDAKKVQALRERASRVSSYEMFDELVKRGFRVEPQVPAAATASTSSSKATRDAAWPLSATATASTALVNGRTTWRASACSNGLAGRSGAASRRALSAA
jgi:hypothetical protein